MIVAGTLNYESSTEHNITIKATDQEGLVVSKQFTIKVNDVNEHPTVTYLLDNEVHVSLFYVLLVCRTSVHLKESFK